LIFNKNYDIINIENKKEVRNMKLKKILPYLDGLCNTIVYVVNLKHPEDEEPVFEGLVMDIPWYLIEYHLIEAKDNECSEAICSYSEFKEGKAVGGIRITLIESEGY
jgi:hypothetical protein